MKPYKGRGGNRTGSGRPSNWQHNPTKTIRVPEILAEALLEIARLLDQGLEDELIINPKTLEAYRQVKRPTLSLSPVRKYRQGKHDVIRINDLVKWLQADR